MQTICGWDGAGHISWCWMPKEAVTLVCARKMTPSSTKPVLPRKVSKEMILLWVASFLVLESDTRRTNSLSRSLSVTTAPLLPSFGFAPRHSFVQKLLSDLETLIGQLTHTSNSICVWRKKEALFAPA